MLYFWCSPVQFKAFKMKELKLHHTSPHVNHTKTSSALCDSWCEQALNICTVVCGEESQCNAQHFLSCFSTCYCNTSLIGPQNSNMLHAKCIWMKKRSSAMQKSTRKESWAIRHTIALKLAIHRSNSGQFLLKWPIYFCGWPYHSTQQKSIVQSTFVEEARRKILGQTVPASNQIQTLFGYFDKW